MKKSTNKRNFALKVFSTSATMTMLFSSILAPMSVFADELDVNNVEEQVQSDEHNHAEEESIKDTAVRTSSRIQNGVVAPSKIVLNSGEGVNELIRKFMADAKVYHAGHLVGSTGCVYPDYNAIYDSGIGWNTSGTYTAVIVVTYGTFTFRTNVTVDYTINYQVTFPSGNTKTIEYGTKFNPNDFFAYVSDSKWVYSSVKKYTGTYKEGAKPGKYTGNLNFTAAPNTGVSFNLTEPVTIIVTDTKLSEATNIVNELFTDNTHTTLIDSVTQEAIDEALAKVNALPETIEKTDLLNLLEKAQELLNANTPEQQAQESVNNLFADGEHTTLAEGVTQSDIDAAKEEVNKLTDEAKKEELLNEIQKAQDLLDGQTAIEQAETNVNNLFGDDEHTTLAEGVTQSDIDAAKEEVNKLTDEAKKEELLNEIQKAQDLLDGQTAIEQAETNVNNLFGDDEHTTLAEGVTQSDIDVTKEEVNKLTDEAKKDELLNEIQKAQDLLNEMNKLTLNKLTAVSKIISGTAKANSQLRISINGAAKTVIYADADGNYEWKAPKLALNDVIKVEMRNAETNKFDKFVEQRITESGVTEETITLNELQEGDTTISGKTTPNGQVRLSFDGVAKNVTTADAQGNYSFVVANGVKTGTDIKVELKSNGTYSISAETKVIARILSLNPITSADDVIISGKTRNPNQRLRISLDGKAKTIITSTNGLFEYRMGKLAADSVVKIEALEGKEVIESVEQIVKGVSNEERPDVKLNPITSTNKTTITGVAPANSSLRISLNGKAKTVVTADADGNFTYMIGKIQSGDKVKVEIRDGGSFVYATEITAN